MTTMMTSIQQPQQWQQQWQYKNDRNVDNKNANQALPSSGTMTIFPVAPDRRNSILLSCNNAMTPMR
jgi:hypothetical protein